MEEAKVLDGKPWETGPQGPMIGKHPQEHKEQEKKQNIPGAIRSQITIPNMSPKTIDAVADILVDGLVQQIKERIREGIVVRPRDDGQFDVKAEFLFVPTNKLQMKVKK